jgi:copper chaperone
MASTNLAITGMTCGHCKKKVEDALQGVDGVFAVFVDQEGGSAEVEYDAGRTTVAAMVSAVEAAGYGAAAG